MAFKLVSSGGSVVDPAVVNMNCSGTVKPGGVVDLLRTGGLGVSVSTGASTSTMIFGVCQSYVQGRSDMQANVIPINKSQLWAADCYHTPTTAMIGIRHILRTTGSASGDERGLLLENTATDAVVDAFGVFLGLAIDTSKGTGTIIGRFIQTDQTDWEQAL